MHSLYALSSPLMSGHGLWKVVLSKRTQSETDNKTPQLVTSSISSSAWGLRCFVNSLIKSGDIQVERRQTWRILHLQLSCVSSLAVSMDDYNPLSIHFTIARSQPLYVNYLPKTNAARMILGMIQRLVRSQKAELISRTSYRESPSRETWSNLGSGMPSHSTRCPFTPTCFAFIRNLFSLSPTKR